MTTTPPAPASPSFGRFLRAPWPGRWLKALAALVVLGAVALLAAIVLITPQLPELNTLTHYQPKQPLRVFTADGVQIGGFGSERRVYQPIAQTPKLMKDSLLAVEDARFYEHGGIDPIGVARAAVSVLSGGLLRRVQGGSSITQQVARTFLLTRERTLTRKLKEALLSLRIESALSKDQILELYMNQIYLGSRAYGFEAAAQTYFGKTLASLTALEQLGLIERRGSRYRLSVRVRRLSDGFDGDRWLLQVAQPLMLAFTRELAILAADRERLAAALAPTLAPAYAGALSWIEDSDLEQPTANAHLAPLQLAADFARTTAQWARLAHRAGHDPEDVRAAVRLASIAVHATGAELHARLAGNPAAVPGLHALGPALELLATVDDELSRGRAPFGYPTAYVPLALGPEDIAHNRSNFDAVQALATDEITQFSQVAADAWQKARDYELKTHALAATELQISTEYDAKLRALCGSLPGKTTPALATCGDQGGQIAELRAAAKAAGLRIRHAAQAAENNLYAVAVEEERFGRVIEIQDRKSVV